MLSLKLRDEVRMGGMIAILAAATVLVVVACQQSSSPGRSGANGDAESDSESMVETGGESVGDADQDDVESGWGDSTGDDPRIYCNEWLTYEDENGEVFLEQEEEGRAIYIDRCVAEEQRQMECSEFLFYEDENGNLRYQLGPDGSPVFIDLCESNESEAWEYDWVEPEEPVFEEEDPTPPSDSDFDIYAEVERPRP